MGFHISDVCFDGNQRAKPIVRSATIIFGIATASLSAIVANVIWRMIGTMHYPFVVSIDKPYSDYSDTSWLVCTQVVVFSPTQLAQG